MKVTPLIVVEASSSLGMTANWDLVPVGHPSEWFAVQRAEAWVQHPAAVQAVHIRFLPMQMAVLCEMAGV